LIVERCNLVLGATMWWIAGGGRGRKAQQREHVFSRLEAEKIDWRGVCHFHAKKIVPTSHKARISRIICRLTSSTMIFMQTIVARESESANTREKRVSINSIAKTRAI
jgi:hypothetical protein